MLPAGERGPEKVVISKPTIENRDERFPLNILLVDGGRVVGLLLLSHLLGRSFFGVSSLSLSSLDLSFLGRPLFFGNGVGDASSSMGGIQNPRKWTGVYCVWDLPVPPTCYRWWIGL
ncbi:hypothetical protein Vadar_002544 [Vaccinium darrowii]|uniref:Uncharacterized protein n=1 Tax=Vaccinium darrowii TaxID=229202 RepID=A0ACB7YBM9_9ERIC|nr:hypothetical protein Vadar_002544 [Vaccinium darrowii]